jgi:hypothetical protein
MYWWMLLSAAIVGALVFAYRDHVRQSQRLAEFFANIAATHGGDVQRATLLTLPQLRFTADGRSFLITAMATSGSVAAGSSGYSGPFTFVNLILPENTHQKIHIVRTDGDLAARLNRAADALAPGNRHVTGHEDFDQAFRCHCSSPDFASRLLSARTRHKLLDARLPRLDVRVMGQKISVHFDGFATLEDDIRELIEIVILLADCCQPAEPAG